MALIFLGGVFAKEPRTRRKYVKTKSEYKNDITATKKKNRKNLKACFCFLLPRDMLFLYSQHDRLGFHTLFLSSGDYLDV